MSDADLPVHPESNLPEPDDQRRWVVVHVRPRCEKKLVAAVVRQGLTPYLPLQRRTHHYGSRVRSFDTPLFPGYAFAWGDVPGRQWLRQNRYTANLLEVSEQARLLDQLRQLQVALRTGHVLEVLPYLQAGRRVRVEAGPLRGTEGIVARIKGQTRIVLNVDMIRESVSVEVDSALLVPV